MELHSASHHAAPTLATLCGEHQTTLGSIIFQIFAELDHPVDDVEHASPRKPHILHDIGNDLHPVHDVDNRQEVSMSIRINPVIQNMGILLLQAFAEVDHPVHGREHADLPLCPLLIALKRHPEGLIDREATGDFQRGLQLLRQFDDAKQVTLRTRYEMITSHPEIRQSVTKTVRSSFTHIARANQKGWQKRTADVMLG